MIIKRNKVEKYPIFTQDMKKGKLVKGDRVCLLRKSPNKYLGVIPIPGIPDIKQYELFKKWHKVVPAEY